MMTPVQSTNFLIVGANSRTNEAITSLAALRHMAVGVNVLEIGSSQSAKFITKILGPELCIRKKSDERLNPAENQGRPYTWSECNSKKALKIETLAILKENVKRWFSNEKQILIIEDTSIFLNCQEGVNYLKQIIAIAKKRKKRVIIGLSPKQLKSAPTLWKSFMHQIVFQPSRADAPSIKQYLRINEPLKFYFKDSFLMKYGNRRSILRLLWSPMDVAILLSNHADLKAPKRTIFKKREELYLALKEKNPKLSETDAWRQAVYYLGIQLPGLNTAQR